MVSKVSTKLHIMSFPGSIKGIRQIVFFSFLLFSVCCYAQTETKPENKIELSVKTTKGISRYQPRSVSLAFSNPSKGMSAGFPPSDDPSAAKKYFIAIDFDTMDTALLQLITNYANEISGELKVTGKDNRIIQKIIFSGASLDNFSSQSSAEEAHVFIYFWCKEITVNEVQLK